MCTRVKFKNINDKEKILKTFTKKKVNPSPREKSQNDGKPRQQNWTQGDNEVIFESVDGKGRQT